MEMLVGMDVLACKRFGSVTCIVSLNQGATRFQRPSAFLLEQKSSNRNFTTKTVLLVCRTRACKAR